MILPSFSNVSYTLPVFGNQTQAQLATRMANVALDLGLPRRWGLIPFGDQTTTAPGPPQTVTRTIQFGIFDGVPGLTAVIDGSGHVTAINITSPAAYAAPPIIVITPAAGDTGTGAAAFPTMGIVDVSFETIGSVAAGSGYNAATTTATILNDGQQASGGVAPGAATPIVAAGGISGVNVASPGTGFNTYPTISIVDSSGAGSGAEVFGWLKMTSIKVTNQGKGYMKVPTVKTLARFRQWTSDNILGVENRVLQSWFTGVMSVALNSPISAAVPFAT